MGNKKSPHHCELFPHTLLYITLTGELIHLFEHESQYVRHGLMKRETNLAIIPQHYPLFFDESTDFTDEQPNS